MPEQTEISQYPLSSAIEALGGKDILLSSTDLDITVVKFPKEKEGAAESSKDLKAMNGVFVTGVRGKVGTGSGTRGKPPKGRPTVRPGDPWVIRWDWDDDKEKKGAHVNLEIGSGPSRTKIAFTMRHHVRPSSDTYHDVIKQMSHHIGYNTLPNGGKTPEDRLHGGRNRNIPARQLLQEAARSLINKWVSEREQPKAML